jgi:hypothetical protein
MKIIEQIKNFLKKNRSIIEKIQLTVFYVISLGLLINTSKDALDKHLNVVTRNKIVKKLLKFKALRLFSSPERSIFWNLFCHELFIRRDIFNTTNLVKFNILLYCMISMVNSLVVTYWNLFFRREAEEFWVNEPAINVMLTDFIYVVIFAVTAISYTYFYIQSLMGLRPEYPNFLKPVIDAASFAVDRKKFIDQEKEKYNI